LHLAGGRAALNQSATLRLSPAPSFLRKQQSSLSGFTGGFMDSCLRRNDGQNERRCAAAERRGISLLARLIQLTDCVGRGYGCGFKDKLSPFPSRLQSMHLFRIAKIFSLRRLGCSVAETQLFTGLQHFDDEESDL
jgi:hypothetical protein